ncbi:sterol-binding protein [Cycloclasticus sp. 46_83_sub15_T18]|mgnify:CR=1 FL=1|nr:sterol-binding protein [Cycloclasticus sp. 46_83_sub15_T18]
MSLLSPLVKPLQIALNRYLDYDPEVPKQLLAMQGNVVELHFRSLELSLYILINATDLDICDDYDGPVDTTISGSPVALAMMGLQSSSVSSLFSGEVTIVGDTELGSRFQALLDNVEVDWEEPLSQLSGDVIAQQVGGLLRGVAGWLEESTNTNALNVSEYLREEQAMLPSKFEEERFKREVDELRLAVDRLEAKVGRLMAKKSAVMDSPDKEKQ